MNKIKIYFWLDILMLIFFIIVAISALILFTGLRLEGIRNQDLKLIHNYSGLILIIIMVIHFLLHFKWVTSVGKSLFKK